MDTQLLTTSLGIVAEKEDGLTPHFYSILFERYPAVRPMFGDDIVPQAEMLKGALVAVLGHLDDADWLSTNLGAPGAKHAAYGATPEMYDAVAECMIAAMEDLGGDEWTSEMSDEWMTALGAVAKLMLAGYPVTYEV